MRSSESIFLNVRGLRYHVRHWPGDSARRVVLLHGWMDVSASFQFLVDAMHSSWDVYAPDWRGYGLSAWSGADCYWMPDYMADLDQVLEQLLPNAPVNLVGHSLGGNIAALYSGVRPERVARLVNLEGFGMARTEAQNAPARYARWLSELRSKPRLRPYADFAQLADRLQKGNSRLTRQRAEFLARHWGEADQHGQVQLRSDPAHKVVNAIQYRFEEARACWEQIKAPVLWLDGAETGTLRQIGISPEDYAERRMAHRTTRYETVADAGHMLHHDQPEAVARLLEEFLLAESA